eukprot:TRINITY_DN23491_c0_g1_i1.p1 TRINITY_DN23491_c0_g1~~TRINITY_DN23491_c0_g1_i1.p1  ORF type:complete len:504 (-),score=94.78 TRINITY_DN23491_c0_g1_i1:100-1611(-)
MMPKRDCLEVSAAKNVKRTLKRPAAVTILDSPDVDERRSTRSSRPSSSSSFSVAPKVERNVSTVDETKSDTIADNATARPVGALLPKGTILAPTPDLVRELWRQLESAQAMSTKREECHLAEIARMRQELRSERDRRHSSETETAKLWKECEHLRDRQDTLEAQALHRERIFYQQLSEVETRIRKTLVKTEKTALSVEADPLPTSQFECEELPPSTPLQVLGSSPVTPLDLVSSCGSGTFGCSSSNVAADLGVDTVVQGESVSVDDSSLLNSRGNDDVATLPPGWIRVPSKTQRGQFYYFNAEKMISSWVLPEETKKRQGVSGVDVVCGGGVPPSVGVLTITEEPTLSSSSHAAAVASSTSTSPIESSLASALPPMFFEPSPLSTCSGFCDASENSVGQWCGSEEGERREAPAGKVGWLRKGGKDWKGGKGGKGKRAKGAKGMKGAKGERRKGEDAGKRGGTVRRAEVEGNSQMPPADAHRVAPNPLWFDLAIANDGVDINEI